MTVDLDVADQALAAARPPWLAGDPARCPGRGHHGRRPAPGRPSCPATRGRWADEVRARLDDLLAAAHRGRQPGRHRARRRRPGGGRRRGRGAAVAAARERAPGPDGRPGRRRQPGRGAARLPAPAPSAGRRAGRRPVARDRGRLPRPAGPGPPARPTRPAPGDDGRPDPPAGAGADAVRRAGRPSWRCWPRRGTQAAAGARHVVVVTGEAGIGKSRLTAEAARRVRRSRRAGAVRAVRPGGDRPLPAGRRGARRPGGGDAARRAARSSATRPWPSWARCCRRSTAPADPAGRDRARLFGAVTDLVAAVAKERPLLLVLDDLQWADDDTLLLVRHLLRRAGDAPVLVVAITRDHDLEPGHALADVVHSLDRDGWVRRLPLRGLDEAEVRRAAGPPARARRPRAGAARRLAAETAGNPFLVTELARAAGVTVGATGDAIPQGVQDLVTTRLARLDADAVELLRCGRGRRRPLRPRRRWAGRGARRPCAARRRRRRARPRASWSRMSADRYRFPHDIVRRTLVAQLSGRAAALAAPAHGRRHRASCAPTSSTSTPRCWPTTARPGADPGRRRARRAVGAAGLGAGRAAQRPGRGGAAVPPGAGPPAPGQRAVSRPRSPPTWASPCWPPATRSAPAPWSTGPRWPAPTAARTSLGRAALALADAAEERPELRPRPATWWRRRPPSPPRPDPLDEEAAADAGGVPTATRVRTPVRAPPRLLVRQLRLADVTADGAAPPAPTAVGRRGRRRACCGRCTGTSPVDRPAAVDERQRPGRRAGRAGRRRRRPRPTGCCAAHEQAMAAATLGDEAATSRPWPPWRRSSTQPATRSAPRSSPSARWPSSTTDGRFDEARVALDAAVAAVAQPGAPPGPTERTPWRAPPRRHRLADRVAAPWTSRRAVLLSDVGGRRPGRTAAPPARPGRPGARRTAAIPWRRPVRAAARPLRRPGVRPRLPHLRRRRHVPPRPPGGRGRRVGRRRAPPAGGAAPPQRLAGPPLGGADPGRAGRGARGPGPPVRPRVDRGPALPRPPGSPATWACAPPLGADPRARASTVAAHGARDCAATAWPRPGGPRWPPSPADGRPHLVPCCFALVARHRLLGGGRQAEVDPGPAPPRQPAGQPTGVACWSTTTPRTGRAVVDARRRHRPGGRRGPERDARPGRPGGQVRPVPATDAAGRGRRARHHAAGAPGPEPGRVGGAQASGSAKGSPRTARAAERVVDGGADGDGLPSSLARQVGAEQAGVALVLELQRQLRPARAHDRALGQHVDVVGPQLVQQPAVVGDGQHAEPRPPSATGWVSASMRRAQARRASTSRPESSSSSSGDGRAQHAQLQRLVLLLLAARQVDVERPVDQPGVEGEALGLDHDLGGDAVGRGRPAACAETWSRSCSDTPGTSVGYCRARNRPACARCHGRQRQQVDAVERDRAARAPRSRAGP